MISGQCLCGANAFQVTGSISNMMHCHCSICRKSNGGVFATYATAGGFQFTKGQSEDRRSYESSPGFFRQFCTHCGSSLPEKFNDNMSFIPAGGLEGDFDSIPSQHIFVGSKASWYAITDALLQCQTYGTDATQKGVEQPSRQDRVGTDATGGSCLCDAVAYQFTGVPSRMMYCHCSRCRRVKNSAHATNLFVTPEQFRWLRGEEAIVQYDLPNAQRFGNSFCSTCGSSVPRQAAQSPLVNIPVGSLDDPPGIDCAGHIFVDSKAPWFEIGDDLPQFAQMP